MKLGREVGEIWSWARGNMIKIYYTKTFLKKNNSKQSPND